MATIKFEKIEEEMLYFLLNLAEENKCRVKETQWRSKHNKYVVYDFEPLNYENFEIIIEIQGEKNALDFVQYLYNKRKEQINYLNSCYHCGEKLSGKHSKDKCGISIETAVELKPKNSSKILF